MKSSFILALSTLVGTIVGAGIFGIPFAIEKSGLIPGLFYFFVLGGIVLLLHLLWGEVCLRTQGKHRIIGYADLYAGKFAKYIATAVIIFVLVGALLAYIILSGTFLHILFPFVPLSSSAFSVLFWAVFSLCILFGIQFLSKLEFILNVGLFLAVALIFLFAAPHIQLHNFSAFHFSGIFVPFGVLFFSLAGWDAIPEIADLFKGKKEKQGLFRVIVWASIITVALYTFFSFLVIGVSGSHTSSEALTGLSQFLGQKIIFIGALLGFFALSSSFLVLGNYLKNTLRYDLHLPIAVSALLALGAPLLLFVFGFREFISVIGFVGTMMAAVEGILMIVIFQKAKTKGKRVPEYSIHVPEPILFLIAAALLGGALASLFL